MGHGSSVQQDNLNNHMAELKSDVSSTGGCEGVGTKKQPLREMISKEMLLTRSKSNIGKTHVKIVETLTHQYPDNLKIISIAKVGGMAVMDITIGDSEILKQVLIVPPGIENEIGIPTPCCNSGLTSPFGSLRQKPAVEDTPSSRKSSLGKISKHLDYVQSALALTGQT